MDIFDSFIINSDKCYICRLSFRIPMCKVTELMLLYISFSMFYVHFDFAYVYCHFSQTNTQHFTTANTNMYIHMYVEREEKL